MDELPIFSNRKAPLDTGQLENQGNISDDDVARLLSRQFRFKPNPKWVDINCWSRQTNLSFERIQAWVEKQQKESEPGRPPSVKRNLTDDERYVEELLLPKFRINPKPSKWDMNSWVRQTKLSFEQIQAWLKKHQKESQPERPPPVESCLGRLCSSQGEKRSDKSGQDMSRKSESKKRRRVSSERDSPSLQSPSAGNHSADSGDFVQKPQYTQEERKRLSADEMLLPLYAANPHPLPYVVDSWIRKTGLGTKQITDWMIKFMRKTEEERAEALLPFQTKTNLEASSVPAKYRSAIQKQKRYQEHHPIQQAENQQSVEIHGNIQGQPQLNPDVPGIQAHRVQNFVEKEINKRPYRNQPVSVLPDTDGEPSTRGLALQPASRVKKQSAEFNLNVLSNTVDKIPGVIVSIGPTCTVTNGLQPVPKLTVHDVEVDTNNKPNQNTQDVQNASPPPKRMRTRPKLPIMDVIPNTVDKPEMTSSLSIGCAASVSNQLQLVQNSVNQSPDLFHTLPSQPQVTASPTDFSETENQTLPADNEISDELNLTSRCRPYISRKTPRFSFAPLYAANPYPQTNVVGYCIKKAGLGTRQETENQTLPADNEINDKLNSTSRCRPYISRKTPRFSFAPLYAANPYPQTNVVGFCIKIAGLGTRQETENHTRPADNEISNELNLTSRCRPYIPRKKRFSPLYAVNPYPQTNVVGFWFKKTGLGARQVTDDERRINSKPSELGMKSWVGRTESRFERTLAWVGQHQKESQPERPPPVESSLGRLCSSHGQKRSDTSGQDMRTKFESKKRRRVFLKRDSSSSAANCSDDPRDITSRCRPYIPKKKPRFSSSPLYAATCIEKTDLETRQGQPIPLRNTVEQPPAMIEASQSLSVQYRFQAAGEILQLATDRLEPNIAQHVTSIINEYVSRL